MRAEEIAEMLDLEPHPEGGYYREIYRSDEEIAGGALPERYDEARAAGTAIYYLLTSDTFSAIHRLRSDEIIHFYLGDPVTVLQLRGDGASETVTLGQKIADGEKPVCVVSRGTWFGMRVQNDGSYALLGTTVAPGFDFDDFEIGDEEQLTTDYPDRADLIRHLTG
ncbi:MAG: cupin domain-containing protein [Planctomycetota bacterium]